MIDFMIISTNVLVPLSAHLTKHQRDFVLGRALPLGHISYEFAFSPRRFMRQRIALKISHENVYTAAAGTTAV